MKFIYFLLSVLLLICCQRMQIAHPQHKDIIEAVYASGRIMPANEYNVYALVSGTIISKNVKDGDSVKPGQVLYSVKSESQSALLRAATDNYNQAQQNLSPASPVLNDLKLSMQTAEQNYLNDSLLFMRYSKLIASDATRQIDYDQAKLNFTIAKNEKKSAEEKYYSEFQNLKLQLSNAKSQLASATEMMGNYSIRSDSNDIVYQTFKEQGEVVHSGELVALLGNASRRIVRLSVDQQDIDKIRIGQQVLLRTDVTANRIYTAIVLQIYPTMNEADQTFKVDAEIPDSVSMPFIHSSVEANVIIQKKQNALVIPRDALINDDSVMIRTSSGKKAVVIQTGILTLDDAEVISGLDTNSEIIVPSTK